MKVLIVEDERDLLQSIGTYLNQNTFICDTADTIAIASEKIALYDYDCIILDITFPIGNGFDILKALKGAKKPCGVLIISAKDALDDKLKGLELGADDYLTKPFHLPELAARLHAINRRRSFDGNDLIILDNLTIDLQDRKVRTDKGAIDLTKKEFELLLYFVSNKRRVITKEAIIEHLWEDQSRISDNYDLVYVHIKNLRKKLIEKGCPDFITAVYGIGYRFSVPEKELVQ